MPLLSADAILKADDLPWEDVDVPEWGGTVRVRRVMAEDFYQYVGNGDGTTKNKIPRFCALAMIDENGKPLFTPEQAEALGKKSYRAMDRVHEVAKRLSGFGEEAKSIEKNFESPETSGPSSSDSPGT